MNASKLRTQLRLGGWQEHGKRLADAILENQGLPLDRVARGRTLRISVGMDGGLVAHLRKRGADPILVATETQLHLRMSEVAVERKPSKRDPVVTLRLPPDVLASLDARAKVRGKGRSAVIRQAIASYLRGNHAQP